MTTLLQLGVCCKIPTKSPIPPPTARGPPHSGKTMTSALPLFQDYQKMPLCPGSCVFLNALILINTLRSRVAPFLPLCFFFLQMGEELLILITLFLKLPTSPCVLVAYTCSFHLTTLIEMAVCKAAATVRVILLHAMVI